MEYMYSCIKYGKVDEGSGKAEIILYIFFGQFPDMLSNS